MQGRMECGQTTRIVEKPQQAADKLLSPLGPKKQGKGKIWRSSGFHQGIQPA